MTKTMQLEHVALWDGADDRGAVSLEWSGDRITGMTAARGGEPAYSVIPGLIDTHVHLIGNAADAPADFMSWPLTTRPEEQVLHGLAHAQRALRAGVTTLRDLSADEVQFSLVRAERLGLVESPRLLAYGMVSMTGGHGDLFTPPAVSQRRPVADGPDACRALVRHWARAGADGIKIATSGGVLSLGDRPEWRNHTDAEIAAIVDEAHALGMRVAAHAHTEAGIDIALRHGVDSLEHATLIGKEQARRVADSHVTVAPTIVINDRIAQGRHANGEQSSKAAELVVERDQAMRAAAAAGVDFVLGTDANGAHVDFGDQMEEVRRMAAILEWDAARALRSATSRAAATVGIGGGVGSVTVGGAADFIVMRGRPWESIDDLDTSGIVAVVSRGKVVAGSLP